MSYFYNENIFLEKKVNEFFYRIAQVNKDQFNNSLTIVLLGSLSRGEATWIYNGDSYQLLSDIEFFTVYPRNFNEFERFEKILHEIGEDVFESNQTSLFHIDNTFVRIESISFLEKKLLTYDAINWGRCVVGENIMHLFPKVDYTNINMCDIHDILIHRMFAVLYYGFPLKKQNKIEEYRYTLAKNSLDLMTVLLVEHKKLESGFINRFKAIQRLDIEVDLKRYFEYCLSIKLNLKNTECDYTIKQMEDMFISLVKELNYNFKYPISNFIFNIKYILRRKVGIIKRAIKYKKLPSIHYLKNLIEKFENKKSLSRDDIKLNLVINGYPGKNI